MEGVQSAIEATISILINSVEIVALGTIIALLAIKIKETKNGTGNDICDSIYTVNYSNGSSINSRQRGKRK